MDDPEQIKTAVKRRFVRLALTPQEEKKFPVGAASARRLGYDANEIDSLPAGADGVLRGRRHPLALGEPRPGEVVLDLGSGAGLDSVLAARRVGPTGRVVGLDFAPEMVAKARRNAEAAEVANAEFVAGDADALPLPDASVDVVISNGVLNLCPDKPGVLAEVFRVLRPGGRLQMADVLLHDEVTPEEVARLGEWSD